MENSPCADFEVWFYDGKNHFKMVIFFSSVYNSIVVDFLNSGNKILRAIMRTRNSDGHIQSYENYKCFKEWD